MKKLQILAVLILSLLFVVSCVSEEEEDDFWEDDQSDTYSGGNSSGDGDTLPESPTDTDSSDTLPDTTDTDYDPSDSDVSDSGSVSDTDPADTDSSDTDSADTDSTDTDSSDTDTGVVEPTETEEEKCVKAGGTWGGSACTKEKNCGNKPENTDWNDGNGKFTQTLNGTTWTPASKNAFYGEGECGFKCVEKYFWNGSACVNPCNADPCSKIDNTASDSCSPIDAEKFSCGCVDGYFWTGEKCQARVFLGNICTGQDKCYNKTKSQTCPVSDFPGQDTEYANQDDPTCISRTLQQSFSVRKVSDNNIVVDKYTGLEWTQKIWSSIASTKAEEQCSNLSYGGESDWRLPTPQELMTIFDSSKYNPAADTEYFSEMGSATNLWSTQTGSNRFYVQYYGGLTSAKSGSQSVMCVRGAELPKASFTASTVNEKNVVTDSTTGLMWQDSSSETMYWQDALKYCETGGGSNYAGYTDWRLPNKNELASLYDHTKTSAPYSEVSESASYWTSTSYSGAPANAFYVDFSTASSAINYKGKGTYKFKVLCVRNANASNEPEGSEEPECSETTATDETPCKNGSLLWSNRSECHSSSIINGECCKDLNDNNYGGYDTWRVPTITELRTVTTCSYTKTGGDCGVNDPDHLSSEYDWVEDLCFDKCSGSSIFSDDDSSYIYWSSSKESDMSSDILYYYYTMNLYEGSINFDKSANHYVRCVVKK